MKPALLLSLLLLGGSWLLAAEEATSTVGFRAFRERRRLELAEELRKRKSEVLGLPYGDAALAQLKEDEDSRRKLAIATHLSQLSDHSG